MDTCTDCRGEPGIVTDGIRTKVDRDRLAARRADEPFLAEVTVADVFLEDETVASGYRPYAVDGADRRLGPLSTALGDRDWLVGDAFTVADLMMSSVMKLVGHTDLVERYGALATWRDRFFARPAYRAAIAEQCWDFEGHGPKDMGSDETNEGEAE